MTTEQKLLQKTLRRALSGEGAHVPSQTVFAGLNWKIAGAHPEYAPHSLFQLLNHIAYWQDWAVQWLDGKNPPLPRHASGSWPGNSSTVNAKEWARAVKRFRKGLRALELRSRKADLFAKPGSKTRLEMLQAIASHNSYHLGQAVLLRQLLGKWPPPSGGLTW